MLLCSHGAVNRVSDRTDGNYEAVISKYLLAAIITCNPKANLGDVLR